MTALALGNRPSLLTRKTKFT